MSNYGESQIYYKDFVFTYNKLYNWKSQLYAKKLYSYLQQFSTKKKDDLRHAEGIIPLLWNHFRVSSDIYQI